MDTVKLNDKHFRPYIPYEQLEQAIDRVAERLNRDFADSEDIPILLCVLNGSILFTAELMKRLRFKLQVVSIKLSSYEGTQSTGISWKITMRRSTVITMIPVSQR